MNKIIITLDVEPDKTNGKSYEILLKTLKNIKTTWYLTHDLDFYFIKEFPKITKELSKNHQIATHIHFKSSKLEKQKEEIIDATNYIRKKGYNTNSFKGGKHEFNKNIAKILKELNYITDHSPVPGMGLIIKKYDGLSYVNYLKLFNDKPFIINGLVSYSESCFPLKKPSLFFGRRFKFAEICNNPKDHFKRMKKYFKNNDTIIIGGHSWDICTNKKIDEKKIQNLKYWLNETKNYQFLTINDLYDITNKNKLKKIKSFNFPMSKIILKITNKIIKILMKKRIK